MHIHIHITVSIFAIGGLTSGKTGGAQDYAGKSASRRSGRLRTHTHFTANFTLYFTTYFGKSASRRAGRLRIMYFVYH